MNFQTGPRPLPECIASMDQDLADGLLPAAVFHNKEIFDLELERIFARTWVFIGHADEVPSPGDFVSRYIGLDPFLLVHGQDGELRVLFNSCRHRGAKVCRTDRGKSAEFACPFHGWTFSNTGELTGVPARKEGYSTLNFDEWGLLQAAHVRNYEGLIFATLNPDAGSFEDYLGGFRYYLDMQLKLSPKGMALLGEPHRWLIEANWKQGAENFCGDSSHTPATHKSALDAGMVRKEFLTRPGGKFRVHVHDCDGHAISIRQVGEGETAFWDYPPELAEEFAASPLSPEQLAIARRAINHNGTIFPNFSFLHFSFTDSEDRPEAGFLSIRVWQPKRPGKTEIWNWILAPREASEEYKARAYKVGMASFGPSGSFEQDDVAVWRGIQETAATTFAKMRGLKFNYQMGIEGSAEFAHNNWPGPGHAVATSACDGGLRTFHKSWYNWITKA